MATLTYATDIAPHLHRGLRYRHQRIQRSHMLCKRECDSYNDDEYIPYAWINADHGIRLLADIFALLGFVARDMILDWLKLNRAQGVARR